MTCLAVCAAMRPMNSSGTSASFSERTSPVSTSSSCTHTRISPGLRVELHAGADGPRRARCRLAHPRLVGRGQGLLEAGQDRLERDPLLALQLPQRLDQFLVHSRSSPPHSNTVRAEAMSSYGIVRSSLVRRDLQLLLVRRAAIVPSSVRAPSTGRGVFTFTRSPTRRANSSGDRSGRSSPGEPDLQRVRSRVEALEVQPPRDASVDVGDRVEVDAALAVDRDAQDLPPLLAAERDLDQLEPGAFHHRPHQPVEVHCHAPSKRKVGASPPSGTALRFRTKV